MALKPFMASSGTTSRTSKSCRGAQVVKYLVVLWLCSAVCSGFVRRHPHSRPLPHPHHAHPHHHHQHHPLSPESNVSPETRGSEQGAAEDVAVDALLEAVKAADLDDAVWGSGNNDVATGVPLFMKLLLRDTERGAIYSEYNQPVAPPVAGTSKNKTLASCLQASRVSVGRTGAMVVEFPKDADEEDAAEDAGWWLVLSLQPGYDAELAANLSVYRTSFTSSDAVPKDLQLLADEPLPNATFVAVDVTKAVKGAPGPWPRFLVDVKPGRGHPRSQDRVGAATVLEVAGRERGPLLVRAVNWGGATSEGMRVWKEIPEDLMHPPRVRSPRRSHRKNSPTSTEGPSSAENPIRTAGATLRPSNAADQDEETSLCHLEAWTVSVEDLGWPFLVAPRTLDINFCVGRCPPLLLDPRFNASTNAIARTAIKMERGAAGAYIPDAQCVPIRFKPIALLISKGAQVDLFTSYDLSADQCGCR